MASDLIQMYFILFVKSSFINSILEDKTFVAKDKIEGLFDTTNRYCLYSKYVNIAVNTGHKLFKSKTCSLNSTIFQVAIHFISPTVVMYDRFFIEIAWLLITSQYFHVQTRHYICYLWSGVSGWSAVYFILSSRNSNWVSTNVAKSLCVWIFNVVWSNPKLFRVSTYYILWKLVPY